MSSKIAEFLEMDIPEDEIDRIEQVRDLVKVEPHEIVPIQNPDLPDMHDVDKKLLEGEKQLEMVIMTGLSQLTDMFQAGSDIDPAKRARFLEVASIVMQQTLDAIKHKNDLQLKKKELRMKEHGYTPANKGSKAGSTTNNLFVGSREELMKLLESSTNAETK